jgi:hypothetical protein
MLRYIDFMLKAPTRGDIRAVLVNSGMWIQAVGPVPAHAADGIEIEEIGPIVIIPAVIDPLTLEIITPAVMDNNVHVNLRITRQWVEAELEGRAEVDADGKPVPLRFLTRLGRWFDSGGTVNTDRHVTLLTRNNVSFLLRETVLTPSRIWQ